MKVEEAELDGREMSDGQKEEDKIRVVVIRV